MGCALSVRRTAAQHSTAQRHARLSAWRQRQRAHAAIANHAAVTLRSPTTVVRSRWSPWITLCARTAPLTGGSLPLCACSLCCRLPPTHPSPRRWPPRVTLPVPPLTAHRSCPGLGRIADRRCIRSWTRTAPAAPPPDRGRIACSSKQTSASHRKERGAETMEALIKMCSERNCRWSDTRQAGCAARSGQRCLPHHAHALAVVALFVTRPLLRHEH